MTSTAATTPPWPARVLPLAEADRDEALAFLGERPLHTVIMAGLMREHGAVVPSPQGSFYGCRDRRGRLEGVALIGRATMFETRTGGAVSVFAELARKCPTVRMIMGEASELEVFWKHYSAGGRGPRLRCRELFYEFSRTSAADDDMGGFRQATLEDLDQVVEAHAAMVLEETGVNPLAEDAEGFRRRCARRVEKGRVWALIERGELVFKADVVTETPEAAYIEGVWVNPAHRLKGNGRRCWHALSRSLLNRTPAFCGFVNYENGPARNFYEVVGGVMRGDYHKVYV